MSRRIQWASLLIACIVAPGVTAKQTTAKQTVDLQYRSVRDWKIDLPTPSFRALKSELVFPNLLSFKSTLRGTALAIDTNGDGKLNAVVTGKKGHVVLRNRSKKFRYALRLINRGGWKFTTSGYARGKIDGVPILVIDQNNNGSYSDYGQDAMVVGRSKSAAFLSKVIAVKGKLYQIDVKKNGSSLSFSPFKKKSGKLNLRKGFQSAGKLSSVILQSLDKQYSFDLARATTPVPAGKYRIVTGKIELGSGIVRVGKGKSKPIVVISGKTTTVKWGGPLKVQFGYLRRGGKVGFDPRQVWYYGRAKEEYFGWTPFGKSPEFLVSDAGGANLAKAVFGGC